MCDFCSRVDDLPKRIFYESKKWFAFLSAPPHTKGHTIIAAQPHGGKCPLDMNEDVLKGLESALFEVTQAIKQCYDPQPKDILLASLRGDAGHFHFHLVPLWPEDEQCWRTVTGYKKAHFMEFLGALEKKHDYLILEREAKEKKGPRIQRAESTQLMAPEIQKLREITGYPKKA
jgi:diadenosine tetraphosphate (Ap4A) HIT family hydrolase